MGKVFKAYDRKISEVVALKIIRPEISINEKAIERFKNELKIARKISHRNICRMHDLGEEGFFYYITMEYVAGEDLKRFIRRAGTLTSGKAINIAKQVCEGLAEAHGLGVIHRDLKPQNIMIDQDGNAKIMDFGIARFVDTERLTGSGVMIGTPEYMSPEQAELKDVDKRADIYSLGIVLYEMVSGRVPFEGGTPLSIAMKHMTEKAKNIRELNAQISAGVAGVIGKCMEKDPANRYESAEGLLKELNEVERELSTTERVVPQKDRASAKGRAASPSKNKLIVPAALVILLAVAVLIVLKSLPRKGSPPPPAQTAESVMQAPQAETKKTAAMTQQPDLSKDKTASQKDSTPVSVPLPKKSEIKGAKPKEAVAGITAPAKKEESKTPPEPQKGTPSDQETNSANLALARVTAAREQSQKKGLSENELFFRLAEAKAQEGQKFISQKSPLEARCLLTLSEKLFRISIDRNKDEDRIDVLKKFVETLRKDLEDKRVFSADDKLYKAAKENEKQALEYVGKKDLENSAKAYVQAAAIYQKFLFSIQAPKKK